MCIHLHINTQFESFLVYFQRFLEPGCFWFRETPDWMQSSTSFALWQKLSLSKEATGKVNLKKIHSQFKYAITLKGLDREGESGYRLIGIEWLGDQIRKNISSIVWESHFGVILRSQAGRDHGFYRVIVTSVWTERE